MYLKQVMKSDYVLSTYIKDQKECIIMNHFKDFKIG